MPAARAAPSRPDIHDLPQAARRPRWWPEVLVIVWLCWVYDDIANLAPLRRTAAYAHARSILHLERLAHLDPEAGLNRWLAGHHTVALWVSNYYDNAHFIVTLGLVGLLWWRYPLLYRPLRNSLVLINVVGLAVFWVYPTAPPRLLDPGRYVDVVADTHAFGSWHTGTLATAANQLAAMPSLHIAWAAWSSLALWRILGGYRNQLGAGCLALPGRHHAGGDGHRQPLPARCGGRAGHHGGRGRLVDRLARGPGWWLRPRASVTRKRLRPASGHLRG